MSVIYSKCKVVLCWGSGIFTIQPNIQVYGEGISGPRAQSRGGGGRG